MLLGQKLAVVANQNGSKFCFRHLAKTMLYKEAYSYINRFSYFLQNEIEHNKKVIVYMSNCPHIAYAFFALANTKNQIFLVDPFTTTDVQLYDLIKEMAIDAVIVSDDLHGRMKEFMKSNRMALPVIPCETRRWGEYDTTYRLPVSMSAADTDVVCYFETAGVAGKKKWVPYTHTMIQQAALILKNIYKNAPIDTFMSYGASFTNPFYFIHGLIFPLLSGNTIEIADWVTSIEDLYKEMLEAKVTRVIMRGTMIEEWLNAFANSNLKIPTLRSITPEYGVIQKATYEKALNDFNVKILNIYGSVESCWALAGRQFEEPEPSETVGRIMAGTKVRILDINGDDIPGNKRQFGQLIVSGPQMATTYFNNKEQTKLNMRGSWFFTGDIVEVDANGIMTFVDRKDNLITIMKEWVVPTEVEAVIQKIPSVERVGVIMTKDQLGKPLVTAVIVKKPGMEVTPQEIQAQCQTLPERQRPQAVFFIQEMPVNIRGIIDKYKLRLEFN